MAGLIQNEDHKSEAELVTAGGTKAQLLNDNKIYVGANSINKTLDDAIIDGDIGGGGVGSASTLFLMQAKDQKITEADEQGNNAEVFNGGVLDGALTLDETVADQILEDKVWKYVAGASSQNDFFGFTKDVLPAFRGKTVNAIISYRTGATAIDNDFRAAIKPENGEVQYFDLNAHNTTDKTTVKHVVSLFIPSDATTIKIGFQNTATTSIELFFDNIEMNNTAIYKDIPVSQSIEAVTDTYIPRGSINTGVLIPTISRNTGTGVISVISSTTDGVSFVANRPCSFIASASFQGGGNGHVGYWTRNATILTVAVPNNIIGQAASYSVAPQGSPDAQVDLDAGDIIRFQTQSTANFFLKSLSIVALATSEHLITAATSDESWAEENQFNARIGNNGTATITSQGGKNSNGDNAISSISRTSIGQVYVTFTAGFFSEIPSIQVSGIGTDARENFNYKNLTASGVTVGQYDTGWGDRDFSISFQRQGDDYIKAKPISAMVAIKAVNTCYLKDIKGSVVQGGTSTTSWAARIFNTISGDTSFCTLQDGTTGTNGTATGFKLEAGDYELETTTLANKVGATRSRFYNATDLTYITDLESLSGYVNAALSTVSVPQITKGSISITKPTVFNYETICDFATAQGYGFAASWGLTNCYSVMKITKTK